MPAHEADFPQILHLPLPTNMGNGKWKMKMKKRNHTLCSQCVIPFFQHNKQLIKHIKHIWGNTYYAALVN